MSDWELLFHLVFGIAGSLILLGMRRVGVLCWVFGGSCLGWTLVAAGAWLTRVEPEPSPDLPQRVIKDDFLSSAACRSCHPGHYQSWHDSFHRTMTQVASPAAVLGSFDDVTLESRGRTYELMQREDEYWVRLIDPDLDELLVKQGGQIDAKQAGVPVVERQIVMTTGSHHYQGYWLSGRGGYGLNQLPFVYHIGEGRWLPREDVFLAPPTDTRHFAHWNTTCIQCHSTAGRPGHDLVQAGFTSEVAELGIGCEACHGPGEEHVRRHQNPLSRYRSRSRSEPDPTIVNPRTCTPQVSAQICGQCHAVFFSKDYADWCKNGYVNSHRPGMELEESRYIFRYGEQPEDALAQQVLEQLPGGLDSIFWPDGAVRVGGREYNGVIESACYQRGDLSCLSCHSMHAGEPDDQLAAGMRGNLACLQCHQAYGESLEAHTHHAADSPGSLCYNCHMPHTTYALLKGIRSHRIESPDLAVSAATGRPHACNLCHLDKTLQWTAGHLTRWYGLATEQIQLSDDQRSVAASLLWLLKGDAAQRVITAWHFGWPPAHAASGSDWQAPFVAQLLDDPYAAIRFVAHKALVTLPGYLDFAYDFVAPFDERLEAKRSAIVHWKSQRTSPSRNWGAHLLLDPSGQLRQQQLDELRAQMDQRPIYITE